MQRTFFKTVIVERYTKTTRLSFLMSGLGSNVSDFVRPSSFFKLTAKVRSKRNIDFPNSRSTCMWYLSENLKVSYAFSD